MAAWNRKKKENFQQDLHEEAAGLLEQVSVCSGERSLV